MFHFVYPIIFGFYYAGFSLIFWGGGGVGVCYNTKTTPQNHPTATVHFPDSNEWCDPFIYPILDWQNNPLIAIGVILGGCLVIPLIHFFWMGLIWIREYIASKTISENTQSDLPTNIFISSIPKLFVSANSWTCLTVCFSWPGRSFPTYPSST